MGQLCIEKPKQKHPENTLQELNQKPQNQPQTQESSLLNPNLTEQEIKEKTQIKLLDSVNTHQNQAIHDIYQILSPPLGSGSYAEVRMGIHKVLGITRAIKIISKLKASNEEITRVLHEAEILKKLDHPNIVKILEIYQNSQQIFIVTELYTGGELFDAIAESQHFSEKEASTILKQVLQGLNYCHQHKIVHRDIKPENIVFESKDKRGTIKIIDFGTSRIFDPHQKMNQKIGTPYYIAPEVLKKKYDEKCDIWSCGVLAYILLCGYPPFNGKSEAKILEKVEQGNYDFNSEEWDIITEQAKDFISKLLEKDPFKRYTAEQALKHTWIVQQNDDIQNQLPQIDRYLKNMKTFKSTKQIQSAIYQYIVNQFSTQEDKSELLKTFKALDTNNDGQLSRQELLIGLKKIMNEDEAIEEVDRIMKDIDQNNSGSIDYSEFVAASINRTKFLSQDRLSKTFKAIDKDGNGQISIDELKLIFGNGLVPDQIWKQIMHEVNDKEEISFQDFSELMQNLAF
ncbi:unnamed protein product [Paramecium sonneborni]|uniref:Calcium-dependent protein kinase 1 n=1 Tax=Paramecium sonneborni TaxID=65129 RepID=A0A8S1K9M4_9CILI|nr:unnamed protein product [Paramecium sonneborni]